MCWNLVLERKIQLKNRHSHDMIFNKQAGGLMNTKKQMDLKRKDTLEAIRKLCVRYSKTYMYMNCAS